MDVIEKRRNAARKQATTFVPELVQLFPHFVERSLKVSDKFSPFKTPSVLQEC